ncbi:hypothetical protein [Dactylosporangium salmoneum]|uniref:Uncharacterized protein n=1 Tax=Dactylosporangium salmoneum TaxID=53361 RepID=A0ABP5T830_9ACTN
MIGPYVVDPKSLADRLIRFVDGTTSPESVLATALRAALLECDAEQQVAVIGLGLDQSLTSHAVYHGRLEMANKVVRRIGEVLERLDDTPRRMKSDPGA